jgi:hypothetical protein
LAALGFALLIWPVSIAVVAWTSSTGNMIGIALLITAGAFLLALAYLGWAMWLTSRHRDRVAPFGVRSRRP